MRNVEAVAMRGSVKIISHQNSYFGLRCSVLLDVRGSVPVLIDDPEQKECADSAERCCGGKAQDGEETKRRKEVVC